MQKYMHKYTYIYLLIGTPVDVAGRTLLELSQ